jgi:hypothetical protein
MFSLALATAALLSPARAATYTETLDVDDLAERADRVVLGEVSAARTERTANGSLVTAYTVVIAETLRGTPAPALELRLPGGRLDGRSLTVPGVPRFTPEDRVVLFLKDGRLVGMGQGVLRVAGGLAVQPVVEDVTPHTDAEVAADEEEGHAFAAVWTLDELRRAVR